MVNYDWVMVNDSTHDEKSDREIVLDSITERENIGKMEVKFLTPFAC